MPFTFKLFPRLIGEQLSTKLLHSKLFLERGLLMETRSTLTQIRPLRPLILKGYQNLNRSFEILRPIFAFDISYMVFWQ